MWYRPSRLDRRALPRCSQRCTGSWQPAAWYRDRLRVAQVDERADGVEAARAHDCRLAHRHYRWSGCDGSAQSAAPQMCSRSLLALLQAPTKRAAQIRNSLIRSRGSTL